jgi:rsbT co-antagonist protein RsbR
MKASLMEAIHALGAPILPIDDGVLAMPVIGRVDEERAARMTESLLRAVVAARCRVAILDLTGVVEVDAATAAHLGRMIAAAALLGARGFLSGVAPGAAQALVGLYNGAGGLSTFGTLAEAHRAAERLLRGSPRAARAPRGGR